MFRFTNLTMKKIASVESICVFYVHLLNFFADGASVGNGPLPEMALRYLIGSVKDIPIEAFNPPQNKNNSLGYRVYTQKNPNHPCFLEPTEEALQRCPINPDDPLILLVCGFIETLKPGNLFEVMKDKILENGPFTVVILDWTKYNGPPVTVAIANMYKIGPLAGKMLNFIIENAGVKAKNIRITGHSLGGHLAGYIGSEVDDLEWIDALDPAGIFFTLPPYNKKLSPTDARFVRVLHSSSELTALGTAEPLGHIDFFPNGGEIQPHCRFGAQYQRTSGDVVTIDNLALKHLCYHELINTYYIYSMNDTYCQFLATNCESYQDFKDRNCPPDDSAEADMGFYGEWINVPEKSKFFLRTRRNPPYCLKNGYKPKNS